MKIPQRPPSLNRLYESRDSQFLLGALSHRSATYRGHYMHWDRLRYRLPPDGLTLEQCWFGMKLARSAQAREVPLRDPAGHPFSYQLPDPAPELLHRIDHGGGGIFDLPNSPTNTDMRDRYLVRSLTEEAITSSQLEGAATPRPIAKEMLRSGRAPRSKGEQMILNNFRAMQRIRTLRDEPLSVERVVELQTILTENTLDDPTAAGRFRRADEGICVVDERDGEVLHTPPPAGELSDRMGAMCAFANGETPQAFIHPVIRAIILHFWLAYDHPFVDGNGRCARALFYWSMLRQRFWLMEFVSISEILLRAPGKYARAYLFTETDENDLTYFILYQLDIIRRALQSLHTYIDDKAREAREMAVQIKTAPDLNHRQRALLNHALRHPGQVYSIQGHQMSHAIVYQTARTDLLDLHNRGFFVLEKAGKKMLYRPASDLAGLLAGKV